MLRTNRNGMVSFTVYSSEKYAQTGNGNVTCSIVSKDFNNDTDLIQKEISRRRAAQRITNDQYKANKSVDPYKDSSWSKAIIIKEEGAPLIEKVLIKNEEIKEEKKKEEIIQVAPPSRHHSADVDLYLDKGTGNSSALIGSSKRGKSTLMMHLYNKYYNTKKFISILFCLNPQIALYKGHSDMLVSRGFNDYSSKLIKATQFINTHVNNKYKFLIMMDDIIGSKYDKIVNELVLTYRNSNISSMFSIQYPKILSPANRANVNNLFIFDFNTDECCHSAIELYLKDQFNKLGHTSKDDRLRFFKEMVKDHGFIYLNPMMNIMTFHRLSI
jgi:hypothetical protein